MSDYVISAVLDLKNKLSGKAKSAKEDLRGLRSALRNVTPAADSAAGALDKLGAKAVKTEKALNGLKRNYYVRLSGKDELSPLLDKVQTRLNRLRNSKTFVNLKAGLTEKFQGGIGGMASGMMMGAGMQMLGGAGIGFGLYNGVKSAMDFEEAMSGVRAITNASQEDFEKLRKKALEMGATIKFTATESAQALNFMGMAGWNAEQSVEGLPGIMYLAAASGEDLAMVSDIVTDSMSAFGMKAKEAGNFADVLAAAATKSNTNVGKMGYTFQYAAPLAGALGFNIQDVALAIGTMADSGIKGEKAGTALRSLFTRLTTEPKQAAAAMDKLGIKIIDSAGNMKPLRSILLDVRKGFQGLTKAEKAQYAAALAGQEGISGLLAIAEGDEKKFNDLANAIDNSAGASKRMADIRLDNLAGDLTYLSSAWDGLILKLMKGDAASGLRGFVKELNSLVDHFSKSIDKHGFGVRSILDLVGKAVTDLKNKFLELDGIGSVLAGGALAGGLYKLYKGAKSIANMVRGSKSGLSGTGNLGESAVGSMTVQAGTVIVNGNGIAGAASGTAGDLAGGAAEGMAGKAGKFGKLREIAAKRKAFKNFSKVAVPLSLGMTAIETYNAEPDKQAETAAKGISGLAGAEVGAAIGTAIAGPVGTIVGGALGHLAGSTVMDKAVSGDISHQIEAEELYQYGSLSKMLDDEIEDFANSGVKLSAMDLWEDKNGIIGPATAVDEDEQRVAEAYDQIKKAAADTGDSITTAFQSASSNTKSIWSEAADWLSGIFARISSAAGSIGTPSGVSASVPANAAGDMHFRGGLSQINEHGGELIDLPGGSKIYPAATTERIIQREMQGPKQSAPSVNISGNTFMVREEADINKIAYALLQMMNQSEMNYGGA